jgi:hypothetical protein
VHEVQRAALLDERGCARRHSFTLQRSLLGSLRTSPLPVGAADQPPDSSAPVMRAFDDVSNRLRSEDLTSASGR